MKENLDFLFHYLRKDGILVDKNEFLFQMQSHPDYPSLLSISDTLHFFRINNGTFRIESSEIHLLPKRFIVTLKDDTQNYADLVTKEPAFYFVEKDGHNFHLKNETNQKVSCSQLKDRWDGVVLLLEEKELSATDIRKGNRLANTYSLLIILAICSSALIFLDYSPVTWKLFAIFPVIGFLFSVLASKDLFGIESGLIEKFCNLSSDSNCNSVLESKKWKIFNFLKLSDLSLVFFTTQLIALLIYISVGAFLHYFSIQKLLLIISLPVIPISLYYQKFVEKKWCPICLTIIVTLIIEITYLLFFVNVNFIFPAKSLALFGVVLFSVFLAWSWIKDNLIKIKELKEYNIKANRFIRNYEIFKLALKSRNKFDLPYTPIVLGSKSNNIEISIISNPWCKYCSEAHKVLMGILQRHENNVCVKIIFNTELFRDDLKELVPETSKNIFRNLIRIFNNDGELSFRISMHEWFQNRDIKSWLQKYHVESDNKLFDIHLIEARKWCLDNGFNFTPAVFINGYAHPPEYDLENLEFYINELIEDTVL